MNEVPERLKAVLPATTSSQWQYLGRVSKQRYSTVHRVSAGSLQLAIKECHGADGRTPDGEAAEIQFTALKRVSDAFDKSQKDARVPKPFIHSAKGALYSMEWLSGRPLTIFLVHRSIQSNKQVDDLARRAAGWLRDFHELKHLNSDTEDMKSRLSVIDRITCYNRMDPLLQVACSQLKAIALEVGSIALPISWLHGDMKTDNLFLDSKGIIGIDVNLKYNGRVVWDMAALMANLDLIKHDPRNYLFRGRIERFSRIFASEYGANGKDWLMPLGWVRCYLLLQNAARSQTSILSFVHKHIGRAALGSALELMDNNKL